MIREIALLGNPVLRTPCEPIEDFHSEETRALITDLSDTLGDFRSRRGFGRGIAAPQIGITRQVIFINFEFQGPLINPIIASRSKRTFRLWDDCFSFPDILVKVDRSYEINVEYQDTDGHRRSLKAEGGLSELLQHEIDHLNGILAIDRAIDTRHIVLRSEHEKLVGQESLKL